MQKGREKGREGRRREGVRETEKRCLKEGRRRYIQKREER